MCCDGIARNCLWSVSSLCAIVSGAVPISWLAETIGSEWYGCILEMLMVYAVYGEIS